MINAKVVTIRCSNHPKQLYGIRLEEDMHKKGEWKITWAFPISEKRARSEKYIDESIDGNFEYTEEYPGCPYCGSMSFYQCYNCNTLNCWDGKTDPVTCANCKKTSGIGGTISSLSGGDH